MSDINGPDQIRSDTDLYKEAVRSQIADRFDLTPIIAQIRSGQFRLKISDSDLAQNFEPFLKTPDGKTYFDENASEKAKPIWNILKPERNALVAIFTEEIWNRFGTKRGELVQNFSVEQIEDIHSNLWSLAERSFKDEVNSWKKDRDERIASIDSDKWDTLDHAYRRFSAMVDFAERNGVGRDDVASFIERGIGTASDTIWGLIKLVPQVLRKNNVAITSERVKEVIKNAYGPFVVGFASMHNHVAIPLLNSLQFQNKGNFRVPFDPQWFSLKQENGSYILDVDHKHLASVTDHEGNPVLKKEKPTPTTWCPAMYAKGKDKKNVIREYFEWSLELAEKYYFSILSKNS